MQLPCEKIFNSGAKLKVKIIGCGLIGSSIALRLAQNGHKIWLEDSSSKNLILAQDLLGAELEQAEIYDLIVIAVPVPEISKVIENLESFNNETTVIDIGGLKSQVISKVESLPEIRNRYVSTHPMAGREFSGPQNARADLFEGRAWIVTPSKYSEGSAIKLAASVGEELGSTSYQLEANQHDEAIAAISHIPQIFSSLLGALVNSENDDSLNFAGQGLRDVSRLADSDPNLWTQLLLLNKEELVPRLKLAKTKLDELQKAIEVGDGQRIYSFLNEGKMGKAKIPGKHGAKNRNYSYLPIVIDDKPGQLANIFDECAIVGVNVEDLMIEHSPKQSTGLITLSLSREDAVKLREHLNLKGWRVHEISESV